jgi:nucleotide-binding universal stress UspA family protein
MKKILVLIDFSDVTDLVVEDAKLFAKSFDAELKIIHVVAPLPREVRDRVQAAGSVVSGLGEMSAVFIGPLNYEVIRDEFAAELKNEHRTMFEIKRKLSNEKVKAKTFLLEGNVSEVVLSQVEEYAPDMVIMGSHGHGYMMKALLGSVTMFLLKHVKCPVMIVPSKKAKEQE